MIKKPTVFIMGAGTSKEYGYPLGSELKEKIEADLKNPDVYWGLCEFLGIDWNRRNELTMNLTTLLTSSPAITIDEFIGRLDRIQHDRDSLVLLAKFLIARTILGYQRQVEIKRGWLDGLFKKMAQGCTSYGDFIQNSVFFIQFNYDMSFELRLIEFIKTMNWADAPKFFDHYSPPIPVRHIYGTVGIRPLEAGSGDQDLELPRSFNNLCISMAQQITTISETNDQAVFYSVKEEIRRSETIFFLGFGYDSTNLENLNPGKLKNARILGTCLGLSSQKKDSLSKESNAFNNPIDLCAETIEEMLNRPEFDGL